MRTLYLTTMIFCHILLSSFILYSTIASASPLAEQPQSVFEPSKNVPAVVMKAQEQQPMQYSAAATDTSKVVAQPAKPQLYKPDSPKITEAFVKETLVQESPVKQQAGPAAPLVEIKEFIKEDVSGKSVQQQQQQQSAETRKNSVEAAEKKQPPKYIDQQQIVPNLVNKEESPIVVGASKPVESVQQQQQQQQQSPVAPFEQNRPELKVIPENKFVIVEPSQAKVFESPKQVEAAIPSLADSVQEKLVASQPEPEVAAAPAVVKQQSPAAAEVVAKPVSMPPAVKGGLGPLHLLAATLCSYQPHKPVSDETLTYLYNQRAAQRKNLFQFMSLKFTNLDKLTSHLNAGLEVAKTVDSSESSLVRSHGWPVVGNCTAHYLKLMSEAAWCDCVDEPNCLRDVQDAKHQQQPAVPRLVRRSTMQEERTSSVMSKLMYVGDIKEAPTVEQKSGPVQPATVASTRQCRRNALRLAKALFNHLAENQTEISESWPKLYHELAYDECARKRMIDIVTALSTFRSESTQVHRDNIEFAFAMDDLRGKVLENEVNTPLTFDKQVIEVEQFLQQSVRLMLANIDPKRAKLTSMRYRSLHAPVSADDQCIELHQRLLAKNYPDECNPNQYGPLPDVLRMAALSLDLWSIEQDLSKYSTASSQAAAPRQQDVNECIANLVAN